MTDPELDELLRRYRPTGPPPELRARVLEGAAAPRARTWPWAASAAALLAATIYLHAAATRIRAEADIIAPANSEAQAVALLSAILGDDAAARAMAEVIVATEQVRAEWERDAGGDVAALEVR